MGRDSVHMMNTSDIIIIFGAMFLKIETFVGEVDCRNGPERLARCMQQDC